jgi:hypothetical protein
LAELPSGTVTFLFTDLERSTRPWEERPDAMIAALARHDELLKAVGSRPRRGRPFTLRVRVARIGARSPARDPMTRVLRS